MGGGDWQHMNLDALSEIYLYLPRRDRMACYFVCKQWRRALDCPKLWSNMVVYLDTDLSEPSTINLTRMYHMHIKTLELTWSNPQQPTKWIPQSYQELTKRSVRFILVLTNTFIELRNMKIVSWFEMHRFKKVIYHLTRFLKTQKSLRSISFSSANLRGVDCLRLLMSCLGSEGSLRSVNIIKCYNHYYQNLSDVPFDMFFEKLTNLVVLKLDYEVFCNGVMDSIVRSGNHKLELVDICIWNNEGTSEISEDEWNVLTKQCSKLRVSFCIHDINQYDDIKRFLKKAVPLTSFSLYRGENWNQLRSAGLRKTLELLYANYYSSLENLYLNSYDNMEMVDDVILKLIKCPNLKAFYFDGVIADMELFAHITKCQQVNPNLQYLTLYPKTISEESHAILNQIYADHARNTSQNKMWIEVSQKRLRSMVYVYYC